MKFAETIGDLRKRQIAGKINKPLKNFHEICEMLGVAEINVKAKMVRKDRPNPKIVHRSTGGGKNSWYDPVEFKAWWKMVQDDVSKA